MEKTSPKPKQEYHFVAFLDVLGYKSYFESDDNDTENFLHLVEVAVKNTINQINAYENHPNLLQGTAQPIIKVFSDNILIAVKCNKTNTDNIIPFLTLVRIVGNIQLKFINRFNLFLRGGVAKGLFYSNENFVFGKGLIKAYEHETSANYPKIMLEKSEVEKVIEETLGRGKLLGTKLDIPNIKRMFKFLISQDGDGNYFVNYLNIYQEFEKVGTGVHPTNFFDLKSIANNPHAQKLFFNPSEPQQQMYDIVNHRKRLVNKIDVYGSYKDITSRSSWSSKDVENRRKVQMKYMWSVDYHNKSCELAGMEEHKINCKMSMDATTHLPKVEVIENDE